MSAAEAAAFGLVDRVIDRITPVPAVIPGPALGSIVNTPITSNPVEVTPEQEPGPAPVQPPNTPKL